MAQAIDLDYTDTKLASPDQKENIIYPLVPPKWWIIGLALLLTTAELVFGLASALQLQISNWRLASAMSAGIVGLGTLALGLSHYNAPWRWLWRKLPILNQWVFPDINGIWVGETESNWPTISKMRDAAQSSAKLGQEELDAISDQADTIVLEVRASLLKITVNAHLASTKGTSHSISARPVKSCSSNKVHLVYTYLQDVPDPKVTDESFHLGAADLLIDLEDLDALRGIYWTRRRWKQGLNTAGKLELRRTSRKHRGGKPLSHFANTRMPAANPGS